MGRAHINSSELRQDQLISGCLDQSSFVFPVIGVRNGKVFSYANYGKMTTIQKSLWKDGYYRGTLLIDVTGTQWVIDDAEKSGYANGFFGWSFMLGQVINVNLVGRRLDLKVDLTDLKKIVLAALGKPYHWVLVGHDSVCEFTKKEAAPLVPLVKESVDVASVIALLADKSKAAPGPNMY